MTAKTKSKSVLRGLMSGQLLLLSLCLAGVTNLPADAPATPTYELLKAFGTPSPGALPYAALIQGADGALYGTAQAGGTGGYGTVFKLNPDGTGFTVLKNFDYDTSGAYPQGSLVQGTDGALYGMTYTGGSYNWGTVFKLNPDGTGFTVLRSFDRHTSGANPYAGLIQGTDGALYGTAYTGGSNNWGTMFKLNPDGTGFTVLRNFDYNTSGAYPQGALMQGTDGALYGTASHGGGSGGGLGTVFKLNLDGTGFTVLRRFDFFTSGNGPYAGLIQGTDGALYGTTYTGGIDNGGTVFKLNPDGSGFTVLKIFENYKTGGRLPAGLLQGTDGTLYGTANGGGSTGYGTIFKLNPDGTGFTVIGSFDYDTSGAYPYAGLIQGTDGALYGTAESGGRFNRGTVFRLNPDRSDFAVLKNLNSFADSTEDGGYLYAGVIQGTDGKLYGTASAGGSSGYGTVFTLNTDGSSFSVLKGDFDYSTDGATPSAGLMQGTDGKLFGVAQHGGSSSNGTVFRLNTDGTGFSVVKGNFNYSTDGAGVYSSLIKGLDGALYGTAPVGGNNGVGTVFKMNPDGGGFTVLKSLGSPPPGVYPRGGLIQGTDGALYGTAQYGGSSSAGTVFKMNPDGTGFTVLKSFEFYTTGGYPYAGLIQGSDGALYGTATEGGSSGYGTVFKLNPDGTGFTVLHNFDYYTTGANPWGKLIQGMDGAIYGTAPYGGSSGYGTVFKMNTDGTSFTVLKGDFDGFNGNPYPGLIQGADGTLYGSTGGTKLFKLNTDGTGFAVLQYYNYIADGTAPFGELIQGPDGTLYGAAYLGGSAFGGTVFKLNTDGTGLTVLKNFDWVTTGSWLRAGLLLGADGALYGTASEGGSSNYGNVFKLNPDGTGFTVLLNFANDTTGGNPWGKLIQGLDGTIYGTTRHGGKFGLGTVFKLNPDGTGFAVLKHFQGPTDISETGGYPVTELMQGPNGTLYGTALWGGSTDGGTVFKLNPDGTGFAVLKGDFNPSTDGGGLSSRLMLGMDGALYGMTYYYGGSDYGTVFKLNPNGSGFTVLKNFDNTTTGGSPTGGLVQRADGTIYGTAATGGNSGAGTLFQLNPDGSDFNVVLNFDGGLGGGQPNGKLIQGADGNLYGTTYQSVNGAGTVFRLVFPSAPAVNLPPLAKCKNVTVSAGANCTAAAPIDDGSFDPDPSDTITVTQDPAGPYALGDTLVMLTVTDNHGASSTCIATVTVSDNTPPTITCPANLSTGCSLDRLATVSYPAPTVFDNCDAHPALTCMPASGSASFAVGTNTVVCKAVDAAGNSNTCSFIVTRVALGFTGFLPPIAGEVGKGTGGSFADPLRAFKFGSTIPVKFQAACGGGPVATGVHTIQAVKYSNSVDSDPAINATPTDAATTGNQFRLTDSASGEWHFNLNTKPLSVGTWKLTAMLSDGSFHEVWITIKK